MLYEISEEEMIFLEHVLNDANIKGREVSKFVRLINTLQNPIPDEVVNEQELNGAKVKANKNNK